ncbi:MAG: hypothetical protein LBV46_04305 [Bacteroidales bacterium]|jgi:UDP-N-acetylmuramoylalanine--D-glutamate ligase|nr:hypothetical protein [Bacteroidales bacterium]
MKTKKNNYTTINSLFTTNNKETRDNVFAKQLINTRLENLKESMSDFTGNDHKLSQVKTMSGISFINDARSTNHNSVWFSLSSMTKSTAWIMSMSDLSLIDDNLLQEIERIVKVIVICGVYNSEVADFFSERGFEVIQVMNIEEATRAAYYACDNDYTVLFSPGNSALSAIESYKERGNKFINAVSQL